MWICDCPRRWFQTLAPALLTLALGTTVQAADPIDAGDPFLYAPGKSEIVKAWLVANNWDFIFDNVNEHTIFARKKDWNTGVTASAQATTASPSSSDRCPRCGKSGDYLYFCSMPQSQSCLTSGLYLQPCQVVILASDCVLYTSYPRCEVSIRTTRSRCAFFCR